MKENSIFLSLFIYAHYSTYLSIVDVAACDPVLRLAAGLVVQPAHLIVVGGACSENAIQIFLSMCVQKKYFVFSASPHWEKMSTMPSCQWASMPEV